MATKIIEKHKKYMIQFPDGTPAEKQAEYMDKINEKLETEQFVVIDPKIKLYDPYKEETVEVPDEVKETPDKSEDKKEETKETPKEEKSDVTNNDIKTEEHSSSEDKGEETSIPSTTKTTVEKIEVPAPKPKAETNILIDGSEGRQGEDGEE